MGGWKKMSGQRVDEFWKAERPGDELMGAFTGTFVTTGGRYGEQTNAVITRKDGKTYGVGISAGLRPLEHFQEGQGVRIVYLGKQRSKSGNEFNAYDVFVWDGSKQGDDPVSEFADQGPDVPFQATDDDVPF